MKTTRITLFALILAGTFAGLFASSGAASAAVAADIHIGPSGRATVDLGFFYDDLSPYGHWVERPQYGWVWTPRAVATTWRPYQNGHWAWTDDGWIWISTEPYGWATYHYGRWYEDPDYGWSWVPGNDYAPAWVSWQEGGDYIGWAPLPPSVEFRAGPLSVSLSPDAYLFVPSRRFLDPRPFQYAVPRQDCERVYRQTRSFTEYQVVNQRIVNRGVPVEQVQRFVGRPVPRYQVTEMSANQRHQGARVSGNRLTVFRPEVQKAQVAPPPQRPVAKRAVLTAPPATAPGKGNNRAGRPVVAGPAPVPDMKGPQGRKPKPQNQPQAPAVARQTPPGQAGRPNHQKGPKVEPVPPVTQAEAKPPAHQRQGRGPRQEQGGNPGNPPNVQPVQPQDKPRGNPHGNRRPEAEQQAPPPPRPQQHAAPPSDRPDRPARQAAPREQPKPPHGQQDHPNQGGGKGGGKGHNKPENDKKPPTA